MRATNQRRRIQRWAWRVGNLRATHTDPLPQPLTRSRKIILRRPSPTISIVNDVGISWKEKTFLRSSSQPSLSQREKNSINGDTIFEMRPEIRPNSLANPIRPPPPPLAHSTLRRDMFSSRYRSEETRESFGDERCSSDFPNKWDQVINQVEFAINNTVFRSTGNTPSRLLFGLDQLGEIHNFLCLNLSQTKDDLSTKSDRIARSSVV